MHLLRFIIHGTSSSHVRFTICGMRRSARVCAKNQTRSFAVLRRDPLHNNSQYLYNIIIIAIIITVTVIIILCTRCVRDFTVSGRDTDDDVLYNIIVLRRYDIICDWPVSVLRFYYYHNGYEEHAVARLRPLSSLCRPIENWYQEDISEPFVSSLRDPRAT